MAWPGPVGPSPDSDGTAPGGSILIHLPADPHRKWTKKNKASVCYNTRYLLLSIYNTCRI